MLLEKLYDWRYVGKGGRATHPLQGSIHSRGLFSNAEWLYTLIEEYDGSHLLDKEPGRDLMHLLSFSLNDECG